MSHLSGFVKQIRDIMRNDAGINGDAQRIEQIAWLLFLKVYDAKEHDWEINEDDYASIIPDECRWCNWAHDDHSGSAMTGDALLDFVNNKLFRTLKELEVDVDTPIKKAIVKSVFEDANQYMKDGVLLRQIVNIIDELDLSDYEESHAFGEIYESILRELQSAGSSGEFYTPRAVTDFMASKIRPKIGETCADFACGTGGFLTSWLKELSPQIGESEENLEAFNNSIYGIEKKPFPYMLCITNMLLHDIDVPQVYHDNSLLRDVLDYTEDDQFDVILMNPPYGGSEKAEVKNHFPSDLASSETADLFMSVIMYRLKKTGRAAVILPDGFLFNTENIKVAIKSKLLSEFNLHTVIRMPESVFAPYTSITTNILFFDAGKPTEEVWFYRLDMPEGYKHFSKTKPMKREHFAPVDEWWDNRIEIKDEKEDESQSETWKAKRYTLHEIKEKNYDIALCGYPVEEKIVLSPEETLDAYNSKRLKLENELETATKALKNYLSGDRNVYLTNIASITKRLTELNSKFPEEMKAALLQAAMEGKLTEHKDSDENAFESFKNIRCRKEEKIKKREIKKEKEIDEKLCNPISVPEYWVPTYLGKVITEFLVPQRDKPKVFDGDIPWCRIEDIEGQYLNGTKSGQYVSRKTIETMNLKVNPPGSVICSCSASLGVQAINTVPCCTNQTFMGLVCPEGVYNRFLLYYLNSLGQDFFHRIGSGTTIKYISQEKMGSIPFPFPPIEEQKRIVEKLDQLLPLCDELAELKA